MLYKYRYYDGGRPSIHKVPKLASLKCHYSTSKKKLEMKLIICIFCIFWFEHWGHPDFLQGDTIIIDEYDQAFSKYSKWQVHNIFTLSQKKALGMEFSKW